MWSLDPMKYGNQENWRGGNLIVLAILFGVIAACLDVMHWLAYHATMISDISLYWLSLRYIFSFTGAFVIGYISREVRITYWLLLILPTVCIEHILFINESDGVSNLWPPILFADIALFSICLPFMLLGKKVRK